MKKAGVITIAIILVAAGVIWLYKKNVEEPQPQNQEKGTLVKEYREWKKYYI